ncbi:hypothetical protein EIP91_009670 [Steccherinum ochraceum]|uniref:Uncharacterized protein n=1 Tax=Steccherinum ochraceum TaxID=92696 RepID=A0A4R0RAR6_9APHY|nr:hypothetical protein EIP91_009670 [Steccherinum ochraceum]
MATDNNASAPSPVMSLVRFQAWNAGLSGFIAARAAHFRAAFGLGIPFGYVWFGFALLYVDTPEKRLPLSPTAQSSSPPSLPPPASAVASATAALRAPSFVVHPRRPDLKLSPPLARAGTHELALEDVRPSSSPGASPVAVQPSSFIISGPISAKTRRDELNAIATELRVLGFPDPKGFNKKESLFRELNKFIDMRKNAIQDDARLLPLVSARAPPQAEAGHSKKTSADRAAEDEAEARKAPVPPSGAYKKLLKHGFSADPPAQYERLHATKPTRVGNVGTVAEREDNESLNPSSPSQHPSPMTSVPQSIDDDGGIQGAGGADDTMASDEGPGDHNSDASGPPPTPKGRGGNQHRQIIIRLCSDVDILEVHLTESNSLRVATELSDGRISYSVLLTDAVPAILKSYSPMKNDKGARLYRAGFTGGGTHISIGSIANFLPGGDTSKHLSSQRINKLKLVKGEDDALVGELYLQPGGHVHDDSLPVLPMNHAPAALEPGNHAEGSNTQGAANPGGSNVPVPGDTPVAAELKVVLSSFIADLEGLGRGTTVNTVLARHLAIVNSAEHLRTNGYTPRSGLHAFRFPQDHHNPTVRGRTFTKADIISALGIGGTSASKYATLVEEVEKHAYARKWIKDPDGPLAAKFGPMSTSELRDWMETHNADGKRTVPKEPKGKKRRAQRGEDEDRPVKKKMTEKAAGKKRATSNVLNSSDLDQEEEVTFDSDED